MIDVELSLGERDLLVRGFAACLSSVTEVPLADLPGPVGKSLEHSLVAWKGWLAGRGSGLVPIADPCSFQWAGWWIAVVDLEGRETAVLAFGTPPGVVLSPQDASLLGRATAGLHITSAYAVAALDPVVQPRRITPEPAGTVGLIAVAPRAEAPMQLVEAARAHPGRGLEGDRYASGVGTFSPRASRRPGYELTLIAAEVVEALTARDARLDFTSTRRNVLTRGTDVNALVGREFSIGDARCVGLRLAEPCAHLERLAGPGLLRPLIHRGGLRADILSEGLIRTGSRIRT